MINGGWTWQQTYDYYNLLRSPHQIKIFIHLLDTNGWVLRDISDRLIDGQVDMDAAAEITRSADLTLLDLDYSLGLDSPNSMIGGTYINRMVRIYYGVAPLGSDAFMNIPIFTGPIVNLNRAGATVKVQAQGKEVLSSAGIWTGWTWPAGWNRSMIVLNALRDVFVGEPWFNFDYLDACIGSNWSIEIGDSLWAKLRGLMEDVGYQIFYDGWGYLRARRKPSGYPSFIFTGDWVTNKPEVEYDQENLINFVRVEGGTPEGAATPLVYTVSAPSWHPFSPWAMAIWGKPRILSVNIQDDSLLNVNDIVTVGNQALNEGLANNVDVSFNSFVVPVFEEYDCYGYNVDGVVGQTNVSKISIPLVGDAEMSMGYLSATSAAKTMVNGVSSIALPQPSPPDAASASSAKKGKKGGKKKGKNGGAKNGRQGGQHAAARAKAKAQAAKAKNKKRKVPKAANPPASTASAKRKRKKK